MSSTMRYLAYLSLNTCIFLCVGLSSGCEVDPYCLTCDDEGSDLDAGVTDGGDGSTGQMDAAIDGDLPDTGPVDAGFPDGCFETELCNEHDDDCDGMVDEGFDTTADVNNCGECGNICSPAHAFGECTDSLCVMGSCDVGWLDLDEDASNGCEYRCSATSEDDAVCDLRDNDCDGEVDEDIDLASDPDNCGACNTVCAFAHAVSSCVDSSCVIASCQDGFFNIDRRQNNGCEYACNLVSATETNCDLVDDNCDGVIDEGDPEGGGSCGTATGACSTGTEHCVGGDVLCVGAVEPTTELCNGVDDDCDGSADEMNPEGGRLCGSRTGTCEQGREECRGGGLVCVGAIGPEDEACDGLDNNCDGVVDDGDPDSGGSCGINTGACDFGTLHCSGGALVCMGDITPTNELCDGIDNNCDGQTDEDNPEGGSLCGTDVGTCAPGVETCTGGRLVCQGETGPVSELCDGLDNDCDGTIDDGNPEGGTSCGNNTGLCTFGMESCSGGTLVCTGGTGPALETCNGMDDDCDGTADENFAFMTDPNNCGSCGNVCNLAHATSNCSSGGCVIISCDPGWVDLDTTDSTGCEYACSFAGGEVCNGEDDDCDGFTDEGLAAPSNFCNPNGVCAGTDATCSGSSGWTCLYPTTFEDTESLCDMVDNDCDGEVDEAFPLVGTSCTNGEVGTCLRTGLYQCTSSEDSVECNAPPSPGGSSETCNGRDDDCDGTVDEGMTPTIIPTVSVPRSGGGTVRVMRYEASRPNATDTSAGSVSTHACSTGNVLPWTTVTWPEASAACCALNSSGTCDSGGAGWRLCDAADWQAACRGPSGSCDWSYSSACSTSSPEKCNGQEFDCLPGTFANDNCLYTTGSPDFPGCRTSWGGLGSIYDMSGNAKEWTETAAGSSIYEIRGGAYTSIEAGRACSFDFTVAQESFSHPNTGFRCCYY